MSKLDIRESVKEIERLRRILGCPEMIIPYPDKIPTLRAQVIYNNQTLTALEEAFKALENADKYGWHDLRKNPTDLPLDGARIEFCIDLDKVNQEFREYETEYNIGRFDKENEWQDGQPTFVADFFADDSLAEGEYVVSKVIGWRYIQPFIPEE